MTLPLPDSDQTTSRVRASDRTVLADRYELESLVGRGGMAEVHRAYDRELGRVVAVKLLPADRRDDPDYAVRLRREAQAVAALSHPHAVGVFDVGVHDGDVFVVLEYVEGRTLRDELSDGGRLPATDAAEVAAAVCEALAVAHDQGIIHRDVNPSNVMRCADGTVKLMDFGIARVTGGPDGPRGRTGTGMVIGTAAYLAPEQVRDSPIDGRADLYALGCTLYELVTGLTPFSGETDVEVAARRLREAPTPPRELVASVPPGLEAVILRSLARRPEDRHDDARAMAVDLRAAAHPDEGAPATTDRIPTGPTDRMDVAHRDATAPSAGESEPWSGVRRLGFALMACALVALLVVAAIVLTR